MSLLKGSENYITVLVLNGTYGLPTDTMNLAQQD